MADAHNASVDDNHLEPQSQLPAENGHHDDDAMDLRRHAVRFLLHRVCSCIVFIERARITRLHCLAFYLCVTVHRYNSRFK